MALACSPSDSSAHHSSFLALPHYHHRHRTAHLYRHRHQSSATTAKTTVAETSANCFTGRFVIDAYASGYCSISVEVRGAATIVIGSLSCYGSSIVIAVAESNGHLNGIATIASSDRRWLAECTARIASVSRSIETQLPH